MKENILIRNNVKVLGNGAQPIIFAPGFGCDQTVWESVSKSFEEEFQVVLFDYVGTGNSDLQAYNVHKYKTLDGYVQDLLDVCSALQLKDAIVVGHSVGSIIGMLASLKQPTYFSHLIMIGPSPCYLNDLPDYYGGFEKQELQGLLDLMEKNYIGWATLFSSTLLNSESHPEIKRDIEIRFCSTDPIIAQQFAKATFFSDHREELQRVEIPTLILQCSEDVIAPVQVGMYMHKNIAASTFNQLEATGHCPHMSHPAETTKAIKDYLKVALETEVTP